MILPGWLKSSIKKIALAVGVIADGIMLFICFTSQVMDLPSKIAFAAIGLTIIILVPIAYEERAMGFWRLLAAIAIFFDTSYLLASTEILPVTDEQRQELAEAKQAAAEAKESLDKTQADYSKALDNPTITAKTQENISILLENNRDDADKKEAAYKALKSKVETGHPEITAERVFEAIPKAITHRPVHLVVYGILASILQWMIAFALKDNNQSSKLKLYMPQFIKNINRKKPGPKPGSKRKPKMETKNAI